MPGRHEFDDWYAAIDADASTRDRLVHEALGLPFELESTSLLPRVGIADVVAALGLAAGAVLLDLGCGRGGYGREVARRTGAALIGVDFSAVAIDRARARGGGDFRVGRLEATGLPDSSVDGIMCIDAMQFASPYRDGLAECRRVLRPGGALVLTGWEPEPADAVGVPDRLRRDIGSELRAAGFAEVTDTHMPQWRAAERTYWDAAVRLDPADGPDVRSLHDEGERTLPWLDSSRRVLVVGVAS